MLVESISLPMDIFPLELQELDVVLGINFLYAHFASMDWNMKVVVFIKLGFPKVVFKGLQKVVSISLSSVLKAKKLLRKGCPTFLAHVLIVQQEKLRPEDVLV